MKEFQWTRSVLEEFGKIKLDFPVDEITTLGEAANNFILWQKSHIVLLPQVRKMTTPPASPGIPSALPGALQAQEIAGPTFKGALIPLLIKKIDPTRKGKDKPPPRRQPEVLATGSKGKERSSPKQQQLKGKTRG